MGKSAAVKRFLVCIAVLFLCQSIAQGSESEISRMVSDRNFVKACVKGFVNESGTNIDPDDFKKVFEKALLNRKSVNFRIVNNQSESDVLIFGTIKNFRYMERGPMKFSISPQAMALDAAASATQNYVEMEVEFTVVGAKTGKVLWKDTIDGYIKKVMSPAESIPLICDKVSRTFLWKSFGRRR